jgi:prolipoprotein diacylglyceryltransferase
MRDMDAFQLGPLIIKYTWIFVCGAGILTYFVIKMMFKEEQDFREAFLDALINAIVITVLGYKASILVFRPELWTSNPLAALYLSGSWREYGIGLLLGGLYLLWKHKKSSWKGALTGKAFVYGIVTFITGYWLFRTLFFLFF